MAPPDPRYLATAIEAVVRAGEIQLARLGTLLSVRKKGAIDIVTEVDVEVERMFRAMIAARFPGHDIQAEELGYEDRGASHRWVFDPVDGTTNYAHGLPIFCASLGLELDFLPDNQAVREIAPALAETVLAASYCPTDGHARGTATASRP